MAARSFYQFLFSLVPGLSYLNAKMTVGATGAVSSVIGNGINTITRLAVGTYRIELQDVYTKLLSVKSVIHSPNAGSNVAATALTPGVVYVITALGTTTQANWVTAGVPSNVTAAVGVAFLAAATSSGNGTAKIAGVSGSNTMELVGSPDTTIISNAIIGSSLYPYIVVQFLGSTDASTTTQIPVDPASGSIIRFDLLMRNSSLKARGE